MPEPSPASAAGTSAMAIVSSGMNAVADPQPDQEERQEHGGEERGVRAVPVSRPEADDDGEHAGDEHPHRRRSAPTSRAVIPSDSAATVSVQGRNASPGLQRAVVADVLQVQRAEEERGVHRR